MSVEKLPVNNGGATTVSIAVLLVEPEPLSMLLITPLVSALLPAVVGATVTVIVHALFEGIEPEDRLKLVAPAAALKVPPQVLMAPDGDANFKPVGKSLLN